MYWGPIKTEQKWPQDTLRVPQGNARFMPPVYKGNADVDRQEAFTMFGTFNFGTVPTAAGQVFNLTIPTDQDGDFWCDQIYMVGWNTLSRLGFNPWGGNMEIADMRTGHQFNYPSGIAGEFFKTFVLFSDDAGFDPASSPFPDGFRSTATLPTPMCFTRQGGIVLRYITPVVLNINVPTILDIAFGGWKEYAYASK